MLISNLPIPKNSILFLSYRGSIARDLSGVESDRDYIGTYIGSLDHYFADDKQDTICSNIDGDDLVLYEVSKYISLLSKANPNILETLWTEPKHFLHTTEAFSEIVSKRHLFVTKKIYQTFSEYSKSQLHKMQSLTSEVLNEFDELEALLVSQDIDIKQLSPKQSIRDKIINGKKLNVYLNRYIDMKRTYFQGGGRLGEKRRNLIKKYNYDCKNACILVLLLKQCIEFLETGNLQVSRLHDRDELLDIKQGKYRLEEVKEIVDILFDKARAAVVLSSLPEDIDREQVKDLKIKLISDFYRSRL